MSDDIEGVGKDMVIVFEHIEGVDTCKYMVIV